MATTEGMTVVGTFRDSDRRQQAITQLSQAGFAQEQIDLIEETALRTTVKVQAGTRYQEVMRILRSNGASNTRIFIATSAQLYQGSDDHGPYSSTIPQGTHR